MKNWVKRALRTFGQAFVGYLSINLAFVDFTADNAVIKSALIGVGVSGIAAGISAVMNILDDKKDGNNESKG